MNPILRPFCPDDLDAVLAIERQSYSNPWTPAMFLAELHDKGYNFGRVAAEAETNDVLGYCFFWIVSGDEVQISNIAVHPNYRRQGIAQRLIEEAVRLGCERGASSVCLEVRESNTTARSFYAKLGFIEVGRRPRYYTNPVEDALILRMKCR